MKKVNFFISSLIALSLSFLSFQCSKDSGGNNNNGNNDPNKIYMNNSVYSNTNLTVAVGATVVWINNDNMIHTVTADDGSFNSGDIQVNASYSRTFSSTGTYPYHCIHHTYMTGTIVVVTK